jgi:hypothetical protein
MQVYNKGCSSSVGLHAFDRMVGLAFKSHVLHFVPLKKYHSYMYICYIEISYSASQKKKSHIVICEGLSSRYLKYCSYLYHCKV